VTDAKIVGRTLPPPRLTKVGTEKYEINAKEVEVDPKVTNVVERRRKKGSLFVGGCEPEGLL
jgi:hypothetical protein